MRPFPGIRNAGVSCMPGFPFRRECSDGLPPPARLFVMYGVLLQERLKNLLFPLIDRPEFFEASPKLTIAVTRAEKPLRIGLPDQFAMALPILPPKEKKSLVMASALGAVAVRFAALARNHRHASDRYVLHSHQPLQEQAALEPESSQRCA
jgi:hypothetical protein